MKGKSLLEVFLFVFITILLHFCAFFFQISDPVTDCALMSVNGKAGFIHTGSGFMIEKLDCVCLHLAACV